MVSNAHVHQLTENSFGSRQGGGGSELGSLFVWMSLANVTSRREKCVSFRKWRRCHLQMPLLKAGFLNGFCQSRIVQI